MAATSVSWGTVFVVGAGAAAIGTALTPAISFVMHLIQHAPDSTALGAGGRASHEGLQSDIRDQHGSTGVGERESSPAKRWVQRGEPVRSVWMASGMEMTRSGARESRTRAGN